MGSGGGDEAVGDEDVGTARRGTRREAFMAPPGHAYPAGHCVAMEELDEQVYPAGPAVTTRSND